MLGKSQAKYIQSLGQKKVRDVEGVFIAEGPKIVAELLASPDMNVESVYALQDWIDAHPGYAGMRNLVEVNEHDLAKISQLTTPNGVLAIVKKKKIPAPTMLKGSVSLVLDTIQDPGNMGTIIRTADWFGVRQVVCSNDCADIYNPKVVQATMGSIIRVNTMYTDLESWLAEQPGIPIYAASLQGENVKEMKSISEGLLIIGNESRGIAPGIMKLVTKKITIPRTGQAESLNAAVAAGILLSHLAK